MHNRKNTAIRASAIFIIFITPPILLYLFVFGKAGLAVSDQSPWSHFATFLGLFVSLANLYVLIAISNSAHKFNIDSAEEKLISEKPVLFLQPDYRNNPERWYVTNIGRGPAMNIRIGIVKSHSNSLYPEFFVKCYSLSAQSKGIYIVNPKQINSIYAFFEDLHGRKYLSITNDHETINVKIDDKKDIAVGNIRIANSDKEALIKRPLISLAFASAEHHYIINFHETSQPL